MPIPHSGKIQVTPLPDVLEQLRQSNATGTLTVRSKDILKCIYVKDGQIVFATSSGIHDRLGEILVKTGKLKRENLDHALKLFKNGAGLKKLGAILVENGLVAPKDLFSALRIQVKDIIFSLFLLTEGEYFFVESLPSDIIQLQIGFEDLISEIIQRMKQTPDR
jgi:hypothetical protein